MATIPAKTHERILAGLKKFQPIMKSAKDRDLNEFNFIDLNPKSVNDIEQLFYWSNDFNRKLFGTLEKRIKKDKSRN